MVVFERESLYKYWTCLVSYRWAPPYFVIAFLFDHITFSWVICFKSELVLKAFSKR